MPLSPLLIIFLLSTLWSICPYHSHHFLLSSYYPLCGAYAHTTLITSSSKTMARDITLSFTLLTSTTLSYIHSFTSTPTHHTLLDFLTTIIYTSYVVDILVNAYILSILPLVGSTNLHSSSIAHHMSPYPSHLMY